MLNIQDLTVAFGERILYKDVNIKFLPGNCYGIIGANGAGKSTLLRVISGEIESNKGSITMGKDARLAILSQDQFAFDEYPVLDTVIMGHKKMFAIMQERDALYEKPDFSEEDGMRAADLESEFADLNGYEAEAEAGTLLSNVGIAEEFQGLYMRDLDAGQKVRVLLAQALFGSPDILLLDEPTNQLDMGTIQWLEEFLFNFENTVIVVSHDRHFLNNVSTHIVDIDFAKVKMFVGNYDFWYKSSQMMQQHLKTDSKRREDKIKELQSFIRRFSANASKSKQATSRKNLIEQLKVDDLPVSSRRFPFVDFQPERATGRMVVEATELAISCEGAAIKNHTLTVNPNDKIAFIGPNDLIKSTLFEVLEGKTEPEAGEIRWGNTIKTSYFPKDHEEWFAADMTLVDWLRQYSDETSESHMRSYLGRMLFSGDEVFKSTTVLSGGEKVRCMLARMMLSGANVLIMDEPTDHLDLEAISSLNEGLIKFPEVILFTSQDYQFVSTIANRIIEITPKGVIDRAIPMEEYVKDEAIKALRLEHYGEGELLRI